MLSMVGWIFAVFLTPLIFFLCVAYSGQISDHYFGDDLIVGAIIVITWIPTMWYWFKYFGRNMMKTGEIL